MSKISVVLIEIIILILFIFFVKGYIFLITLFLIMLYKGRYYYFVVALLFDLYNYSGIDNVFLIAPATFLSLFALFLNKKLKKVIYKGF